VKKHKQELRKRTALTRAHPNTHTLTRALADANTHTNRYSTKYTVQLRRVHVYADARIRTDTQRPYCSAHTRHRARLRASVNVSACMATCACHCVLRAACCELHAACCVVLTRFPCCAYIVDVGADNNAFAPYAGARDCNALAHAPAHIHTQANMHTQTRTRSPRTRSRAH
jgi:hypothetical protein